MDAAERHALNEAMVRLADGDRSAFPIVFASLHPLLRGFAARFLRDADEAEDVAQHALLKVFEHAVRFEPGRDAATWALAITANACRATRRSVRASESLDLAEDVRDAAPDPETRAVERDLVSAAEATLAALRPDDAAVLVAAWRGDRVGAASPSMRKRVQRATERLRAAWRNRHGSI